ncbi:MAG TPA: hypothetical protein PLW24_16880 [Burkholderiaceae bacterium]|nr:hypothetical protein [Burkholderiaceae bacterium]
MGSLINVTGISLNFSPKGLLTRSDKKQANRDLLSLFRTAVCDHQGRIAQHFLLGNEYHKRLRLLIDSGDKPRVLEQVKKLNQLHVDALRDAWAVSVKHLRDYFLLTHKSPRPPRLCIKASKRVHQPDGVEENCIVVVFREDGSRSPEHYSISGNSGFNYVETKGKYFLENNIPEAVKLRGYRNHRLNHKFAADYKESSKLSPKYYFEKEDREWIKCWDSDVAAPSDSQACYKSTLIVPMTLMYNSLSEEFVETGVGQAATIGRSIYGFLCFDHTDKFYFQDVDVNVGYIFADLLSLYRITSDALLTKSAVVEGARKFR